MSQAMSLVDCLFVPPDALSQLRRELERMSPGKEGVDKFNKQFAMIRNQMLLAGRKPSPKLIDYPGGIYDANIHAQNEGTLASFKAEATKTYFTKLCTAAKRDRAGRR